uniref:Uncharacterized protein n=1 Tax=Trypanosoma vivax (strain Y486) TaxID=1055687 RepID=G0UBV3_TRYVY|nr:hypothetical protein, unlikely [Trypanosoma vivax Y486]
MQPISLPCALRHAAKGAYMSPAFPRSDHHSSSFHPRLIFLLTTTLLFLSFLYFHFPIFFSFCFFIFTLHPFNIRQLLQHCNMSVPPKQQLRSLVSFFNKHFTTALQKFTFFPKRKF